MIYDIALRIRHRYATPASLGRHLVRLMPTDRPGAQRVLNGQLDISPAPDERTERVDIFGNATTDFAYRGTLRAIALDLHVRVERLAPQAPRGASLSLCDMPQALAGIASLAPDAPVHFMAPSPFVPRDATMAAYARARVAPHMTARAAVLAVGGALHADMRYDPEATEVDTPASEAFAARHGVCQDFSHILIGCLRGIGIPAGYVSGFLRTNPPPGRPRLEGADAMHAWVRAWCGPEAGWMEFDPTNDVEAGEDHVTVARGRDYGDVSPVRGVMRGAGRQSSEHAVDVVPLGA